MDGVVIVDKATGVLHFTKDFSRRFERLHPKADRMNLGALLFAIQNFAGGSFHDKNDQQQDTQSDVEPELSLFETRGERMVLAQCQCHQLLIVMFMHPSVDLNAAKSLVRRTAFYYALDSANDTPAIATLRHNARLFCLASERAIDDEVDAHLARFQAALMVDTTSSSTSPGFLLFYYAEPENNETPQRLGQRSFRPEEMDINDDPFQIRGGGTWESSASSGVSKARASSRAAARVEPACIHEGVQDPRRGLCESTRGLLSTAGTKVMKHLRKTSKNTVGAITSPKRYQRVFVSTAQSTTDVNELNQRKRLTRVLADRLQPFVSSLIPTRNRQLIEMTWQNCQLPSMYSNAVFGVRYSTSPSTPFIKVNLRIWAREDGVVVYPVDQSSKHVDDGSAKQQALNLLDILEPMAQFALKLRS